MKGKGTFTHTEKQEIERLISQKIVSSATEQKGIRAKIRKLGFYASDYGIGGGYTVADFRNAIEGKPILKAKKTVDNKVNKPKVASQTKLKDEAYIINLCDEVLGLKGSRQHRFDFLRGDTGVKLPVDSFYPTLSLVIEYRERQHTEEVGFFNKRITANGDTRGEQRKRYDTLRITELPKNDIKLVIFDYSEFEHTSSKRLIRDREKDIEVIKTKLT
jgi:hypothetical protein